MTVFARISALLCESARLELLSKQFGFPVEVIEANFLPADPTNGKYLTWILKQAKLGQLRFPEDAEKVHTRLTQFDQLKRKPQFQDPKDLNQYKTYSELAQTIEASLGIQTKGEVSRQRAIEGSELVREWVSEGRGGGSDKKLAVYKITTHEALVAHGAKRTEWCVKDEAYFDSYGPPFYLLLVDGKPKKLLHVNSKQCMTEWDEPTDWREFEDAGLDLDAMHDWYSMHKRIDRVLVTRRGPLFDKVIKMLKEGILHLDWEQVNIFIEELGAGQDPSDVGNWERTNGWRELEQTILETVQARYPDRMIVGGDHTLIPMYAKNVLKGRWEEGEEVLLSPTTNKDAQSKAIFQYARYVIFYEAGGEGWNRGEPTLLENCLAHGKHQCLWWATLYSGTRGRWPELETVFLNLLAGEEADFVSDIDVESAVDRYNQQFYVNSRTMRIPFPDTRKDAINTGWMKPDGFGGYIHNLNP